MRRVLAAATVLALAIPTGIPASPTADSLYAIATMLTGSWEGSTPGNALRLAISNVVIEPQRPYDLFLSVTGTFGKTSVVQQGVIRLETQGKDIYFIYMPHFNPSVTALSNDAGVFSPEELSATCSFTLNPRGDGFVGNTLGAATCARAMRGAIGKWSVEIEPGNLRVRNADTAETLRFRLVSKPKK